MYPKSPSFQPVMTLVLSQPNDMQLSQGILCFSNSSAMRLKMFLPVAGPSHCGTDKTSDFTAEVS